MATKKLCFLFSVFLSMVGTRALAYDIQVMNADGVTIYYNYINDETELEVTYCVYGIGYYFDAVVIPEEVTYMNRTRKVTSIGEYAFYQCWNLTSVTIPNSVTSIGEAAFESCFFRLTSVTIGNNVKSIGKRAFYDCRILTSITIPGSVKSIGEDAFFGCWELTSITIPDSVTSIGKGAFNQCIGLTSINVDSRNTVYDSRDNCNGIIETNTNTLITGCQSTIIPNSVTSIEDYAFYQCRNLTSIKIPGSVTGIGLAAFAGCSSLTSVSIGNGVTNIGTSAFADCSGLTSVTIPGSVTSIGWMAFKSCIGLTSINVDPRNTVYDSRDNCNGIIETNTNTLIIGCQSTIIPNSVTAISNSAFYGCSGLASVIIPGSVTSIGGLAFGDCSGLTSITIPNSVTSIENFAFQGCTGLTSINVDPRNTIYDSRDNCNGIIETNTNTLIVGCQSTNIPNSVTSIGGNAFTGCIGLTSVIIPSSVTGIGRAAFGDCIGLTSVTIPGSVTSIGEYAFSGCSGLTSVIVGRKTPVAIQSGTFSNRTNAMLYVPGGSKSAYENAAFWNEFKIILEDDVMSTFEIAATPVFVENEGGIVTLTGVANGQAVSMYNLSGQQMGSATGRDGKAVVSTSMHSGEVAIVKIGLIALKVRLK